MPFTASFVGSLGGAYMFDGIKQPFAYHNTSSFRHGIMTMTHVCHHDNGCTIIDHMQ